MSRCAECNNLIEGIRRANGTLLFCLEKNCYVSPARIACDKFVSGWRTYNDVYKLLNETYYNVPSPSIEDKELQRRIELSNQKPFIKKKKLLPCFLDRILKKAGYDENHVRYKDLADIYNNVIRKYETPEYLEKLDELLDTHIMMEFLANPDSEKIAEIAINETIDMRLIDRNESEKIYRAWLDYLKILYKLLRVARINNPELDYYVLKLKK